MISVIIPIFNSEEYIRQCLDSVCNQSYTDLEIIAVDDGSRDSSTEILAEFAGSDPRVHVITQKNQGVSAARNQGIRSATGEWIAFVDSDDRLEPVTLEKAISAAEQDRTDIVMWSYVREYSSGPKPLRIFGNSKEVYRRDPLLFPYRSIVGPVGDELSKPQKLNSGVTVWGKLYRRSVIGDSRMVDIDKVGSEDTLFNVEVFANAASVSYLPDCLYHYRKENPQSFTHQNHQRILSQFSELYRRIGEKIEGREPELKEALQNRICLGLIGLGMRFTRHKGNGFVSKYRALKGMLCLKEYRAALKQLQFRFLPLHWKIFFFCAKYHMILAFYSLLKLMDRIRKLA